VKNKMVPLERLKDGMDGKHFVELALRAYSMQSGHPFHGKLATQSTPN
jgi:hypothetical protein